MCAVSLKLAYFNSFRTEMGHPLLRHLSIFSWMGVLESEEKCISFLEDLGLVPKKDEAPRCPVCSGPMNATKNKRYKIGWFWTCRKRSTAPCSGSVNPLKNTFFEEFHIPFADIMAIIFGHIMDIDETFLYQQMLSWRQSRKEKAIALDTFECLIEELVEIAEIVLSRSGEKVGGSSDKIFNHYRKKRLDTAKSLGDQVHRFLMDIRDVYPGYGKKDFQF